MERIDLHTHSSASDGTDTVGELVDAAAAADLQVIALTDHDTTIGWAAAADAVRRTGVAVVPGIEVSTQYGGHSIHVLALLPDPGPSTPLAAELSRARTDRVGRARRMVELIGQDHPISWEDVLDQTAGEDTTIGRPHIADALVAADVVPDRSAAFADILASRGRYYVPHYAPPPGAAVRAIVAAGGVPIIAHPASGTRGSETPLPVLEEMVEAGLAGIEVDHREHDERQRARLRSFARAHGLLVTGGSDYHGRGKPNRLGENLTLPDVLDAVISLSTSTTEVLRA
ncbi:MAG: PHP domain-containing protein [Brachybacterium sp.]|nr:PHP domain-containing protein [Brachybacterium sp.]